MWNGIKMKKTYIIWLVSLWALLLLSITFHLFISYHDIAGFWTDGFIYLLQADYFSSTNSEYFPVLEQAITYRNFPPLYPFYLSVLGAGSNNIALASAATSFLLLPFCLFYIDWQVKEGLTISSALINAILFLFLPSTLLFSTELWSENLYLLLVFFTLWGFHRINSGNRKWIYISAFVCGLAFITRSVGLSLIVAFLIVVFKSDKKNIIFSSIIIIIPYLIWTFISRGLEYDNMYLKHGFIERYENILMDYGESGIYEVIQLQLKTLWQGIQLQFNSTTNIATFISAMIISIAACFSLFRRICVFSIDALYVFIYFGIIFVWNFPDHNVRFIYVVTPFILFYAKLTMDLLFKESDKNIKSLTNAFLAVIILTTILPALIFMEDRYTTVPGEYYSKKSNDRMWLTGPDTKEMNKQLVFKKKLVESIVEIQEVVPKNSCVYSTHKEVVMFYSKRKTFVPPRQHVKEKNFNKELTKCHYIFIVGSRHDQYEPLYPVDRIKDNSWILRQTFFPAEHGGDIISALLELDEVITK